MHNLLDYRSVIRQLGFFGLVGIAATFTHVICAFALHYYVGLSPLIANFFAFLIAWTCSYFGHFQLTFKGATIHRTGFPRFAAISVFGFLLNQSIIWFVAEYLAVSFFIAMACVIFIVPALTFFALKFWAFKHAN